uniref:Uncharacterized protein n=1 Tax=Moniliophthora roreri TaxID=221103 RepID=A0A0W0ETM0_MONRR
MGRRSDSLTLCYVTCAATSTTSTKSEGNEKASRFKFDSLLAQGMI